MATIRTLISSDDRVVYMVTDDRGGTVQIALTVDQTIEVIRQTIEAIRIIRDDRTPALIRPPAPRDMIYSE